MKADIQIDATGSLYYLTPMNEKGWNWIAENVESESWQWQGLSLAVDHRYAEDIALGARAEGLKVSTAFCYF
jgi:hypothetical protein